MRPAPQQRQRDDDTDQQHQWAPGQVRPQQPLHYRPHHKHADEHPVTPHWHGRLRGTGVGPERAERVCDHDHSVGSHAALRISRKHEARLDREAEELRPHA